MWYLSESIYLFQIVNLFDIGRETSMYTENFIIHHRSNGEEVKDFCKSSPYIQRAILFDTLIIKTIDLSNQSWLVITSQKSDSVFVSNFEC